MADGLPAHTLADPYGGRGPLIMGIAWTEASIALVLMLMRTYTNALVVKSFKWDYFWAMLALVTGMISQATLTVSTTSGMGNHILLLKPPQIVKSVEWAWIAQCLVIQSIGFGKYAVIAFILCIQDRAQSRRTTLSTCSLYFIGVSNFFINITEMAWTALSDILLVVIPVFVFWDLKISNKLKVGLCLLMAGGLVSAVAGVLKTIYIKLLLVETDITYALSPLLIWAWTEHWLLLSLGSLPPLRSLFTQVFQRIPTQYVRNSNHGYRKQSDPKSIPMYPPASRRAPGDTDSERDMLPMGASILQTIDVQVIINPSCSRDNSNENLNVVERGVAF